MIITFTNTSVEYQRLIVRIVREATPMLPILDGDDTEDLWLRVEARVGLWTSIGEDEEDDADYFMMIDITDGVNGIAPRVFHELKHLEQLVEGRLAWPTDDTIIWGGAEYDAEEVTMIRDRSIYKELPWEVEAVEFENLAETLLTSWREAGEYGLINKEALQWARS